MDLKLGSGEEVSLNLGGVRGKVSGVVNMTKMHCLKLSKN